MSSIGTPTTNTASASSSSVAVTKPTGLAVNDLMLAQVITRDSATGATTPNTPTGWTIVYSDSTSSFGYIVFRKMADSADVAASTFTFSGSSGTNKVIASMSKFSGVDLVTPINASSNAKTTGTSLATATITPNIQSMFVMFSSVFVGTGGIRTVSGYSMVTSNPAWTEAFDVNDGSTSHLSMAYAGGRTAITATGAVTATVSSSADENSLGILALTPTVFRPASLAGALIVNNIIIPFLAQSFFALLTVVEPVIVIVANKWSNTQKNVSAWLNPPKS